MGAATHPANPTDSELRSGAPRLRPFTSPREEGGRHPGTRDDPPIAIGVAGPSAGFAAEAARTARIGEHSGPPAARPDRIAPAQTTTGHGPTDTAAAVGPAGSSGGMSRRLDAAPRGPGTRLLSDRRTAPVGAGPGAVAQAGRTSARACSRPTIAAASPDAAEPPLSGRSRPDFTNLGIPKRMTK